MKKDETPNSWDRVNYTLKSICYHARGLSSHFSRVLGEVSLGSIIRESKSNALKCGQGDK
jgi:hypothetical protein